MIEKKNNCSCFYLQQLKLTSSLSKIHQKRFKNHLRKKKLKHKTELSIPKINKNKSINLSNEFFLEKRRIDGKQERKKFQV